MVERIMVDSERPERFTPADLGACRQSDDPLMQGLVGWYDEACEHMEWIGDQLDSTRLELREVTERAAMWELQYRRLVTELADISKLRWSELPPPEATTQGLRAVPSAGGGADHAD